MALRNSRWRILRRLTIALAVTAGVAELSVPAGAQFFDDRYPSSRRQYAPPRDYFSFPFVNGDRFNPWIRPPAPVESYKPPPPRKLETPPTSTVVVIGDSLADWLAYGLEETYADTPETGVERKTRPTAGLIRYDSHNESLEWSQVVKDTLATEKPSAIVVMLGVNDRLPFRDKSPARPAGQTPQSPPPGQGAAPAPAKTEAAPQDTEQPAVAASEPQRPGPGGSYDFHTDKWAELYSKRIDEMIAVLKAKGVPVLWVGMPSIRGTRSTSDMSYLDDLYRARAEKAGIIYVDIWDGFVDEQGRYAVQGPDFEGQTRRLRTGDGVHFTKAGAVKLANYVERELRRVMSNHVMPVAMPGPEQTLKPGGPRPAIGPVLPLTASTGGEGGDLLGAGGSRPAPVTPDPVATEVLGRGVPLAAPPGRADDFSWPRRGSEANATPEAAPEPAALTPAGPLKKGAAAKSDVKKPADAKADAKTKPAPDAGAAKPRRSPSASLDGAPPRPPAAISGGF